MLTNKVRRTDVADVFIGVLLDIMGNLDKIPLHLVRHVTRIGFGWKKKQRKEEKEERRD